MPEPATRDVPFETASWPRRFLALVVDWIVSTLVVIAFTGWAAYTEVGSTASRWVLLVFVLETALFTGLLGGSFGKLLTRLRVVPADGARRPTPLWRALGRQVLVALVIPPLVFRPDGRGLHDLFARTATVTLDEFRRLLGR